MDNREERDDLIEKITSVMIKLEPADLAFLLKQAQTLDHNRRAREEFASAEADDAEEAARSGSSDASAVQTKELHIERSGNFFNIIYGDARLFMDRVELTNLYEIADAAGDASEAAPRLFRWLKKERSDVLADCGIVSAASPVLVLLYERLLESFTRG